MKSVDILYFFLLYYLTPFQWERLNSVFEAVPFWWQNQLLTFVSCLNWRNSWNSAATGENNSSKVCYPRPVEENLSRQHTRCNTLSLWFITHLLYLRQASAVEQIKHIWSGKDNNWWTSQVLYTSLSVLLNGWVFFFFFQDYILSKILPLSISSSLQWFWNLSIFKTDPVYEIWHKKQTNV